ncbi:MAG: hypothetical protein CVU77_04235 [Elusimicrobia bacterium HGW-Elusimicrobia-1]|nr:MAG: hypothetical protein CVU77_04235 [Elusimicrobia bacterium HGW-Elusimicrobia-1]
MKLPSFSVRRPVATTMAYLAVVVLSVVALTRLPLDILPEITFPAITVTTTYQGAGPEDVEKQITSTVESMLGIVQGLKEIRSNSVENMSIVRLMFDWGTNLDEVANDVRTRLEFAKRFLPSEAGTPVLLKFDLSQAPVMFLTASADENYGRLNEILNDEVAEPLKRVSGIGNVFVIGGEERQIRVDVSRRRLEAYNIGLSQITQALAAHNLTLPAGDINVGGQAFFLRLPAEFKTVREVGDTLVGFHQGRPVFLKDIAEVSDAFAEPTMIARQETRKSALMIVQKRSGANTVKVADGVTAQIEILKKRLPSDVDIMVAYNLADDVKRTISGLTTSVLIGGLLVVLVTYLFLFNLRSSLVILITIPISLIVSFLFLYLMGYTINIMSLSSIAIAIGMVVDNAIVVLENIVRRGQEYNESSVDAAINGAAEVGLAVSASTLTTVVVFLPLIFSSGLVGILFKQLGSVISITLLISLAISLTLSPMIASLVLGKKNTSTRRHPVREKLENYMERFLAVVSAAVLEILGYALARRKKTVFVAAGIFVISLALLPFIGTEFLPSEDAGFLQAKVKMPVNTPLKDADAFAVRLIGESGRILGNEREVIFARTGSSPFGGGGMSQEGSHIIEMSFRLKEKNKRRTDKALADILRKRFSEIPGPWKIDFQTGDMMSQRMGGSGKPLSIEIVGYDIGVTDELAAKVKSILENTPGAVDVTISREKGKLEYQLKADRRKLSALGIAPALVADALNIAFGGRTATSYRAGKNEYDVFVRLAPEDRKDIRDVLDMPVKTPDGRSFLVRELVSADLAAGPLTIDRKDQQRFLTVDANISGRSLGDVAAAAESRIRQIALPPGVYVEFAGSVKEQREAFRDLLLAFLLAAMLTYMVMAAQFESFRDPFIIMFSVPFAIVGVLWGLFLTGQTLNVASFIGLIMLVGIVVNNAIVYIDYTIRLRRDSKMSVKEALVESARVRLRPILMTTVTTIFGMMPMALSTAQGSETWQPLATAVIGGLLFSTLITLVLVPVLYDIFEERLGKF